jgi:hypothetical protein
MRFEDFDKKIKEAADQHYPAYDEKAWKKMETLLDVYLPRQKDDRRRIIFLLLLFFLLSGGILLWITAPRKTLNKPVAASNKSILQSPDASSQNGASSKSNVVIERRDNKTIVSPDKINNSAKSAYHRLDEKVTGKETAVNAIGVINDRLKRVELNTNREREEINNESGAEKIAGDRGIEKEKEKGIDKASKNKPRNSISEDFSKTNISTNIADKKSVVDSGDKTSDANKTDVGKPIISSPMASENKKQDDKATSARDQKSIKKSRPLPLGISVSSGMDVSAVGTKYVGKAKLLYGAGLSYGIKRIVLRTGIYFSRKIYSTEPDEYHLPNGWPNYYDLQRVDADCEIIQLPVSVSYLLSQSKNHNWFVSTGLTSFLMKRETYNYLFKVSGGPVQSSEWTLYNKNKHYFSVLNLSGGYERKFNERISLSAEPYINLPLEGIGFGKVKLMSTGVMFTLTFKPFTMKK